LTELFKNVSDIAFLKHCVLFVFSLAVVEVTLTV